MSYGRQGDGSLHRRLKTDHAGMDQFLLGQDHRGIRENSVAHDRRRHHEGMAGVFQVETGGPVKMSLANRMSQNKSSLKELISADQIEKRVAELAQRIFESLHGSVTYVFGEALNRHCGNMEQVLRAVSQYDRDLRSSFEKTCKDREY